MPRTVITPQSITNYKGAQVTFVALDSVNGMQYRSTGREVVLIKTGASSGVTTKVPSLPDVKARLETAQISNAGVGIGSDTVAQFGPYDPTIFGDGSGNVQLDFSSTSGAGTQPLSIAVVLIN